MAPEPPNPDPEKVRRSRSFGSFLLFLFLLIVVLIYVGSSSISGPDKLSQDQYKWALHSGRIVAQEFQGSENGANKIEGVYRREGEAGKEHPFETSFADVARLEDHFQALGAIPTPEPIAEATLRAALDGGWYSPVDARSLTATLDPRPERQSKSIFGGQTEETDQAESDGSSFGRTQSADEPEPDAEKTHSKLVVSVIARSLRSWRAERGGMYSEAVPPFPLPVSSGKRWFEVQMEEVDDLELLLGNLETAGAVIEQHQFQITPDQGTSFADSNNMLTTFLFVYGPWVLIFAVILIVMRQMRSQGGAGGVMSFGRSRAQLYSKESRTNVTFDDVAGANEAKAEVREIVEFLKNPGRFTRIGGRIPHGVMLVGPPGCGKTLLAKAIAGEAEVPFFSISGSDFVEMFVGVGASRVRDLFKQARETSPCIIFLDEIDAVGRRRGSGMGGGHDEREQTLNAILVEMDGFGTDEGIIVIAATNRPDVLDPALLRPGRFDREVTIDLPDVEGRAAILKVHLKRVKTDDEVDVSVLAKSTPGYSGADLAAIVNEAAIMAVLAKRDEIEMDDLEEARDKVRYGRQKISRKIEEEDRRITACHEAGHTLVAAEIEEVDNPHKITIVPRGRALGSTMVLPEKESYHTQRKRLVGELAVLFGGRVAEARFCGDISAGASDDIRRATEVARAMVTELGMSEKIGPVNYAERQGSDFLGTELMRSRTHSEETAREIDQEVRHILDQAYERAETIINTRPEVIQELTEALLLFETISGSEVEMVMQGVRAPDLRPDLPDGRGEVSSASPSGSSDGSEAQGQTGELPGSPGLSPA